MEYLNIVIMAVLFPYDLCLKEKDLGSPWPIYYESHRIAFRFRFVDVMLGDEELCEE